MLKKAFRFLWVPFLSHERKGTGGLKWTRTTAPQGSPWSRRVVPVGTSLRSLPRPNSASLTPPQAALGSVPRAIRRFLRWPLPPSRKGMVGSSGLEPPTSRLSGARSNQLSYEPIPGGDERVRTAGLLLARQALSHLSYTPMPCFVKVRPQASCCVPGASASVCPFRPANNPPDRLLPSAPVSTPCLQGRRSPI